MVNNYPNQNNRNNSNSNNQQNSAQRFYDQPTDMQYNDSNNHHQRQIRLVPPPSRKNMDPVDSPRTPGRRTRSELNDDDDFQQDVQNKKQRQRSTEVEFDNQWENRQRSHNEDNSLLQQQQYHHQHQQIQIHVTNNDNNNPSPPRPTQQHEQKQQQPQQQRFSLRTTDAHTIAHENRSNQQSNRITSESARYAQTRFPFQPFIIRFSSGKVKEKQAAQELVKHYKDIQHTDMSIAHIRQSTLKCQQNDYDLLIYVKDSLSFITLFDQQNWPKKIDGMDFTFPSTPSFPPQLAFIIKNVDLQMNMDDFTNEVKTTYPEIHNVIRLKNKFQNNIKLIKIEILSSMKREEILNKGKIIVQSMTYDVEAYLAPADVLICSKCMGIGHFRRQCTEADETCKVCGTSCPDLRQHKCSTVIKCIHCDGDHHSNALKCPIKIIHKNMAVAPSRVQTVQPQSYFRPINNSFNLLPSEKVYREWEYHDNICCCNNAYYTALTDIRLLTRYQENLCSESCSEPSHTDSAIFLRDIDQMRECRGEQPTFFFLLWVTLVCAWPCYLTRRIFCPKPKCLEIFGSFGSEIVRVKREDMLVAQVDVSTAVINSKLVGRS
ncbi:unnamed protein product [Rotaria socialis]